MPFFAVKMKRVIRLEPKYFGPNLSDTVLGKIQDEFENTCTGQYGYIVLVLTNETTTNPRTVDPADGFCEFAVEFQAIVCRPMKGEVLDCVVTIVTNVGIFAEAGPVQIFVSNKLMPPNMSFNAEGTPSYVSNDGAVSITKDSEVRVRIVGTRVDTSEIFSIGSINEEYLGVRQ